MPIQMVSEQRAGGSKIVNFVRVAFKDSVDCTWSQTFTTISEIIHRIGLKE